MNTKERKILKGIASTTETIFQIGKGGVSDAMVNEIKQALQARELVKISVLRTAEFSAKDIIAELAERTESEPVQTIGNKVVLYKVSTKDGVKHILPLL